LQDVWVVTVPIYNKGGYISNIPVPTGIWKIVYINGGVKYYFAENTESGKVKQYPSVPIQTILNNSRNF
jgi:DNA/RNA endonuclease G (NUC1)